MGKLTDMVAEDMPISERVKINARRLRLAGIGLFSKVETERMRLYKQITEMGDGYGADDSLVGKLSLVSTGTISLVVEESQRVFDDLVEEGERALSKDKPKVILAREKITTSRPVAKPKVNPKLMQTGKPSTQNKTVHAHSKTANPSGPVLSEELKARFQNVQKYIVELKEVSDSHADDISALTQQINGGDVTGRRPAQSKVKERAIYDARRNLKGMKAEEALRRLEAIVESLSPEPVE